MGARYRTAKPTAMLPIAGTSLIPLHPSFRAGEGTAEGFATLPAAAPHPAVRFCDTATAVLTLAHLSWVATAYSKGAKNI